MKFLLTFPSDMGTFSCNIPTQTEQSLAAFCGPSPTFYKEHEPKQNEKYTHLLGYNLNEYISSVTYLYLKTLHKFMDFN